MELPFLHANIILGNPRKKCKRLGICKIEIIDKFTEKDIEHFTIKNKKSVLAKLVFKNECFIEIYFCRKSINDRKFNRHFKSGLFEIEENIFFRDVKTNKYIKLYKGYYKLFLSKNYIMFEIEYSFENQVELRILAQEDYSKIMQK